MNILLTDGSHKNTLAILRYLGSQGHTITILHHKKSAPAYSKFCHNLLLCPPIENDDAYVHYILKEVSSHHYDILIPVGVLAVNILSKYFYNLREHVAIELAHHDDIKKALEKRLTFQFAEKNNIDHPRTVYPTHVDEALVLSARLRYPVVLKSSNEAIIKFPTIYVNNQDELKHSLQGLIKKNEQAIVRCFPLIQERIVGKGYGFFAIYQHGVCKKVFMHERIREIPVSGGSSTCARSYYSRELLEAGKRVLDGLHWHGQAMVEFKKDIVDGKYKLIEVNPKFWGSVELCMAAGMNFPSFLCDMATGKELAYSEEYDRERIFLWIVSPDGELHRLFQKPSDIISVLIDWLRPSSRSDFWISDIMPTLVQLGYFLVFLINKLLTLFRKK